MIKRILIADDEPAVRQLLEVVLVSQGYEVLQAHNGDQLVRMAQERVPDLVLVDLMMPYLDGYEAIRQLRNDTRTAHLPMIILTAKSAPDDLVTGFETGADDYVTKPFNIPELLARIKSHLRRASQRPVRNPLTDLPGNVLITEEIKYRLKQPEPFVFMYIDLDNFKAFNDTYGPARGDRVIRLLADILTEKVRGQGGSTDFIGHIGGDDFVVITSPANAEQISKLIIEAFDERVRLLYDASDLERGYLPGTDRQGMTRQFPIMTLSIGAVSNAQRTFTDHEEMVRVAAEMKQFAKQQANSYYALDARDGQTVAIPTERRGSALPTILLLSGDVQLRAMLYTALQSGLYRVLEASDVLAANALLVQEPQPAMIIGDARLGEPLWDMFDSLRSTSPHIPLLLFTTRVEDEQVALSHGVNAIIRQPFQIQQVLDAVSQLVRPGE
jgi:diguanylate cyclase (GGDEF)-like protein